MSNTMGFASGTELPTLPEHLTSPRFLVHFWLLHSGFCYHFFDLQLTPLVSSNNRQHNGQKKKSKRTNNDQQNIHIKTFARYCVVQRNKLTCWRYANGSDIKKSVTFLPYWTFWLDMDKSGKKTNEQANLAYSTCILVWQ